MTEATSREFVQSLARGLSVVRVFDASHRELTLSEVAQRSNLSRAAARRFLHTLVELGYVRESGRDFSLTPRVLELGYSYLSALRLPEVVHPHLERLSRLVDESVSAAVLDGFDIVYVSRVPTRRIMSVGITIGTRFPAHATSMGRVLLAHLSSPMAALPESLVPVTATTVTDPDELLDLLVRIRADGYALVDSELEEGVRSIAAPIHLRGGRVVAAVNVSTTTARVSLGRLVNECLPALLDTTAAIDAELVHL